MEREGHQLGRGWMGVVGSMVPMGRMGRKVGCLTHFDSRQHTLIQTPRFLRCHRLVEGGQHIFHRHPRRPLLLLDFLDVFGKS
jgi:hypothetical protein